MDSDPRYAPVDSLFEGVYLCPVTQLEASKAAKLILRKFGKRSLGGPSMGADLTYTRTRRCWAASKPNADEYSGWRRLVHDISHRIFRRRHPTFRPHDGGHARLEREIAQFVIASGWLSGSLRKQPKAKPAPQDKLARIEARIVQWERKQRRAENAIRKLKRQRSAMARRVAAPTRVDAVHASV